MKNKILWPVLFLCTLPVQAQQDMTEAEGSVTLQECLSRGLESNFSIRMVKNQQETAANNATRANAGMLPTVDLSASYSGDLGSTRTTPRSTGVTTTERGAYDGTVDAGIDLNWTIFDGFSVWTNYKQLQLLKEQGELQTRITIEDYVASLTAEYYNYIQEKIRLKNFRYAMSLSRERMRIVEVRYHIGNFSRLDYLQAKVDFNADSAQYMKQREVLNSSRIKLNELMANHDVTALIGIRDTAIDVNPDLQYDELWQATLATNASLLMADKNTEVVRADYKKIMSRDYPYVRLNAGYGYTLNRYELSSTKKRDNWGLNAGITIGFNLFDGKRKMQKRNAQLAIEYAELEREVPTPDFLFPCGKKPYNSGKTDQNPDINDIFPDQCHRIDGRCSSENHQNIENIGADHITERHIQFIFARCNHRGHKFWQAGSTGNNRKSDQILAESQLRSNRGCAVYNKIPTELDRHNTADDKHNTFPHRQYLILIISGSSTRFQCRAHHPDQKSDKYNKTYS